MAKRPLGGHSRRLIEQHPRDLNSFEHGGFSALTPVPTLTETLLPQDRGKHHLRQAPSATSEFRPSRRVLDPRFGRPAEQSFRQTGRRRVPEPRPAEIKRSEQFHDLKAQTRSGYDEPEPDVRWDTKARVRWPGKADDARAYVSYERRLEDECGRKVRVPSMQHQRNNIPMRHQGDKVYAFADYAPGFHTRPREDQHNTLSAAETAHLANDGVNFRPAPSYEEKKLVANYQADIESVRDLAAPLGGEDSEEEAAA